MNQFSVATVVIMFELVFAYTCCVGEVPPLPKIYRPAKGVTKGAGAELLMAPRLVVPPGRTNIGIAWRYHTNDPAIVFNVRSLKTNTYAHPSLSWPIVAVVTGWTYSTAIDKRATCVWYSVTATNVVNGLESEFARR